MSDEIKPGCYIWDDLNKHVGVIDQVHESGAVHYRVHEVGHDRPHGYWSAKADLTVLIGRIPYETSTIAERMQFDVVSGNPTFSRDDTGELFWADRDGTTYKVEFRIPGLSLEQSWVGGDGKSGLLG